MIDILNTRFHRIVDPVLQRIGIKPQKMSEFIKFAFVGGSGVVVNMGLFYILTRHLSVKIEFASPVAIEISILTVPERIIVTQPEDYAKEIVVGRDGLIVSHGARRGLLLPQVPVEHERNWDSMTFLEHTCQKAGLPQNAWKDKSTQIHIFSAEVFSEETVK